MFYSALLLFSSDRPKFTMKSIYSIQILFFVQFVISLFVPQVIRDDYYNFINSGVAAKSNQSSPSAGLEKRSSELNLALGSSLFGPSKSKVIVMNLDVSEELVTTLKHELLAALKKELTAQVSDFQRSRDHSVSLSESNSVPIILASRELSPYEHGSVIVVVPAPEHLINELPSRYFVFVYEIIAIPDHDMDLESENDHGSSSGQEAVVYLYNRFDKVLSKVQVSTGSSESSKRAFTENRFEGNKEPAFDRKSEFTKRSVVEGSFDFTRRDGTKGNSELKKRSLPDQDANIEKKEFAEEIPLKLRIPLRHSTVSAMDLEVTSSGPSILSEADKKRMELRVSNLFKPHDQGFSLMSYAFQRLDGELLYGQEKKVMDPKRRVFSNGKVVREFSNEAEDESESESDLGLDPSATPAAPREAPEPEVVLTEEQALEDEDFLPSESETPSEEIESEQEEQEDACFPVTWYNIFHHSVFGTPKLCQK